VSPSWRSRVEILLGRDRVAVGRLRRGFRDVPEACHSEPCARMEKRSAWQDAVEALDKVLRAFACRGAAATVILSNAYVRYQVVPWLDQFSAGAERDALARHGFRRTYGDAAEGWAVRVSDEGYGAPAIASAVDRELPDAVTAAADRHGLRLASVQPYLMWAFNRWRPIVAEADFCLALVENGHACLALATGGRWLAVRSAPLAEGDPQSALAALVERELCLAALDPARVKVYVRAPEHQRFEPRGDRLPACVVLGENGAAAPAGCGDALFALAGRS
jgi:hypothetical protein